MSEPDFALEISSTRGRSFCELYEVFSGVLREYALAFDRRNVSDAAFCKYVEKTIGEYEPFDEEAIRGADWEELNSSVFLYFALAESHKEIENRLCSIWFEKYEHEDIGEVGWSVYVQLDSVGMNFWDFVEEAEQWAPEGPWRESFIPVTYTLYDVKDSKEKARTVDYFECKGREYSDVWQWAIFWSFWLRFSALAENAKCTMVWRQGIDPVTARFSG